MIEYLTMTSIVVLMTRGFLGVSVLILIVVLEQSWSDTPRQVQRNFEENQQRIQRRNKRSKGFK